MMPRRVISKELEIVSAVLRSRRGRRWGRSGLLCGRYVKPGPTSSVPSTVYLGNGQFHPEGSFLYSHIPHALEKGRAFHRNRQQETRAMTYVVTEACVKCKYTDCVDVCPVDCFREGPNFLVIDPEECIDCT